MTKDHPTTSRILRRGGKKSHTAPTATYDSTHQNYTILADLFYDGTLLKSAIIVENNGSITIHPREMIQKTSPTSQFKADSA